MVEVFAQMLDLNIFVIAEKKPETQPEFRKGWIVDLSEQDVSSESLVGSILARGYWVMVTADADTVQKALELFKRKVK